MAGGHAHQASQSDQLNDENFGPFARRGRIDCLVRLIYWESQKWSRSVPSSQVRLLENAYRKDFEDGMQWLRTNARPGDLVLIFFSGYGSTIEDDDGDEADGLDEVFVMYDAQGVTQPSAQHVVRDDEFAVWVERLPTDRVIMFVDASPSGRLRKSLTNARTKFFVGGNLGRPPRTGSWHQPGPHPRRKEMAGGVDGNKGLVYAAAQDNEYALEVVDGGLFVTRLLQQVSQAQNARVSDLFARTQRLVNLDSCGQQTPVVVGNTRLGEALNLTTAIH